MLLIPPVETLRILCPQKDPSHSRYLGHLQFSSPVKRSPKVSLCRTFRFSSRARSSITRSGFGCPTISRAFDFTALVTENFFSFFFVATLAPPPVCRSFESMEYFSPDVFESGAQTYGRTRFFRRKARDAHAHP